MLSILAAGSVAGAVNQAGGAIWAPLGEFGTNVVIMLVQIVISLGAMFGGYAAAGTAGFVVGVACLELLVYPFQSILVARGRLWQPEVDLPVLPLGGLVVGLGYLLR